MIRVISVIRYREKPTVKNAERNLNAVRVRVYHINGVNREVHYMTKILLSEIDLMKLLAGVDVVISADPTTGEDIILTAPNTDALGIMKTDKNNLKLIAQVMTRLFRYVYYEDGVNKTEMAMEWLFSISYVGVRGISWSGREERFITSLFGDD